MKLNYEEMVEKAVKELKVNISNEDKKTLIGLIENTNSMVKILNNFESGRELSSTQIVAHIITSFFGELYVAGRISFN